MVFCCLFLVIHGGGMHGYAWGQDADPQEQDSCLIFALGDSLTAGYGLAPEHGFTALLQERLDSLGYSVQVVNAGVSGDTTEGGLARLDWALGGLDRSPDVALVELGANDALRGDDPAETYANLEHIVLRLKEQGAVVLLAGMYAMANMGQEYSDEYNTLFARLADKHELVFYPFFLEGVAGNNELNQWDGIHPNEQGTQIIVDRILPTVEQTLALAGCSIEP